MTPEEEGALRSRLAEVERESEHRRQMLVSVMNERDAWKEDADREWGASATMRSILLDALVRLVPWAESRAYEPDGLRAGALAEARAAIAKARGK